MVEETAIQTRIGTLAETLAIKYNMDWEKFIKTFKATVFKSCKREPSSEELAVLMMISKQYDLNPFVGQIFAFPTKSGGIIPVVGIDGFITIAERNKEYDGFEMEFSSAKTTPEGGKECPEWCEVKIFRKHQSHPTVVREYLDEVYVPARGKDGGYPGPWQSHTKRMLRHKTLIQGFRVAMAITGIYDEDEASRIDDNIVEIKSKPSFVSYEERERLAEASAPAAEIKVDNSANMQTPSSVTTSTPIAPVEYETTAIPPAVLDGEKALYGKANKIQIKMIEDNVKLTAEPGKSMDWILKKYKVQRYSELTSEQAEAIIALQDRAKEGKK